MLQERLGLSEGEACRIVGEHRVLPRGLMSPAAQGGGTGATNAKGSDARGNARVIWPHLGRRRDALKCTATRSEPAIRDVSWLGWREKVAQC
jgi:hypothetical protein